MQDNQTNIKLTNEITPHHDLFSVDLKEVWRYRDMVYMLLKREFVTTFKQTILGPLWFFINPILTTLVYVLVFGQVAGLSTDGVPQFVFYLSGVSLWGFFSLSFFSISNVLRDYSYMFGKVYFPRLVIPIALIFSNLMRLGIQILVLIIFVLYYWLIDDKANVKPNIWFFVFPYFILLISFLSMGVGMIFSSFTTKYRDLVHVINLGIQLFMYATPVVMPASLFRKTLGGYSWIIDINPLTGIFEGFKYGFLGSGDFESSMLIYPTVLSVVLLFIGVLVYNKTEKTFMDNV